MYDIQLATTWVIMFIVTASACTGQTFTEQTDIVLTGVFRSSVAWGDCDNDGDLDVLLTGYTGSYPTRVSKIYLNNGNNSFTELTSSGLTGVDRSDVAWGDYDNDGDLDILLTGYRDYSPYYVSKLYNNSGNGTFAETDVTFPGLYESSVAWGDYDNDGDLDILLTGGAASSGSGVTKIYRNNGLDGFTELSNLDLTQIFSSSVAWGDYDNDGDLDILLSGWDATSSDTTVTKIYRNEGGGAFVDVPNLGLPQVGSGSVAWGDYDNDGDLDILLCGTFGPPTYGNIARIYRNDGVTGFVEVPDADLTDVSPGCAKWGDFDNDGDLDVLLAGDGGAKLYRNDGGGIFSEVSGLTIPGVYYASVDWGDYDNDGDLDILLTGSTSTSSGQLTKVFRNETVTANSSPSAPDSCVATVADGRLAITWDSSTDAQTPSAGLSYNLEIESSPGIVTRCSPMCNESNGWRRIVGLGPVQGTQWAWAPVSVACGSYRCRVQTIDTAFAGSEFSAWSTPVALVGVPDDITASDGQGGGVQVTWTAVPGATSYEVWRGYSSNPVEAEHITLGADPIGTSYSDTTGEIEVNYYYWLRAISGGQPSAFSYPDIGSRGRFLEQVNAGIPNISDGSTDWGDYDNDGDLDILLTGNTTSSGYGVTKIYQNTGDGAFLDSTIALPGLNLSSAKWGDYDNDGDLDILMAGRSNPSERITRIYRNDGDNVFMDTGITLPGVIQCSLAWGDYDSDGWLDFIIAGTTGSYPFETNICRLYHNNGDGNFTEQCDVDLPGFSGGTLTWGDYDNDGDLDLLLAGWAGSWDVVFNVYRNDGNNQFSVLTGPGATDCSAAWGDYDNDGDLDFLIAGDFGNDRYTLIYNNEGSDTFILQTEIPLPGFYSGAVAWGDMDNDGDLDILISGFADTGPASRIYRNEGSNVFMELPEGPLPGLYSSSMCWGDYDNDGDLDFLMTGSPGISPYRCSLLFRNESPVSNTLPFAPAVVEASAVDGRLHAAWTSGSDNQTPSVGLSYNARIRPATGPGEWGTPMSRTDGWRRIASLGPLQGTNWNWNPVGVPCGAYRVAVQAVDTTFAGSPFTEAAGDVTLIGVPANVKASDGRGNTPGQVDITWSAIAGAESYEVWRSTNAEPATAEHISVGHNPIVAAYTDAPPIPWKKYYYWVCTRFQGQSSAFGLPDSGYTGCFTEQTNVLLEPLHHSQVAWGDYDADGFLDLFLSGYRYINPGYTYFSLIYRNNQEGGFIKAGTIGNYYGWGAWGDYDNDGKLDLLKYDSPRYVNVYHNQGDGTFAVQTSITLQNISWGGGAWGDYDNDGALDILLTGYLGSPIYSRTTRLYHNNRDGTFSENTNSVFIGINGSVAWGDYDNDGNTDILLAGEYGSGSYRRTLVYHNNGNSTFTLATGFSLTGIDSGSVAWGDYDNDGDLDILLTGFVSTYTFTFKVYRNDGTGFTELIGTPGVVYSSASWGDFDNDGDLDILVTGQSSNSDNAPIAYIYRNDGNDVFIRQTTGVSLTGVQNGSAEWGDYDNDGDLDIIVTGNASIGSQPDLAVTKLYRNDGPVSNSSPTAPSGLAASFGPNGTAALTWTPATDVSSASMGLSYNVRVGSLPGLGDICGPMSDLSTGQRRVSAMGNANKNEHLAINGLRQDRVYYWSVQAIDTSFAGGAWSAEDTFGLADSDHDGMPDAWENANGLVVGVNDANLHGDADSFDNISEYVAGTNPKDELSFFHISSIASQSGDSTLTWPAVEGRFYTVDWTSNLLNNVWIDLATYLTNGMFVDTVHTNADKSFYKCKVRLQ